MRSTSLHTPLVQHPRQSSENYAFHRRVLYCDIEKRRCSNVSTVTNEGILPLIGTSLLSNFRCRWLASFLTKPCLEITLTCRDQAPDYIPTCSVGTTTPRCLTRLFKGRQRIYTHLHSSEAHLPLLTRLELFARFLAGHYFGRCPETNSHDGTRSLDFQLSQITTILCWLIRYFSGPPTTSSSCVNSETASQNMAYLSGDRFIPPTNFRTGVYSRSEIGETVLAQVV